MKRVSAWGSFARNWARGRDGGPVALAVAAALAGLSFALTVAAPQLGDAPLFLLVVPLALCASAYGLVGGTGFGLVASALAALWWLLNEEAGGYAWFASRAGACLAIGILLGWLTQTREALARQLQDHSELSLDLIATAGFDGYFRKVNPAFTRTLGHSEQELLAVPFLDFVHDEDRDSTIAAAAAQTEDGNPVISFQNRYRTKNGGYRWLEWTSRPNPQDKTLIAVARDITDRKQLEEHEHRYHEQLEHAVKERTHDLELLTEELQEARLETLRRLALAAEYRDDTTFDHTQRVGRTAAALAQRLGVPDAEIEIIRLAAPLHDIGKLGVPDSILLKPGKLTPDEMARVRRHTLDGARILTGSNSTVLRCGELIALHHHEWWNGTGYPHGLKGEEIPLAARLVALADVFDALTHERPYKRAWPIEHAINEIVALRGRQFDPHAVEAFQDLDAHMLARSTDDRPHHLAA